MPKPAAALEDALAKKGGLSLAQLVDYDDRLTDALVDRVRVPRVDSGPSMLILCAGLLLEHDPQTPPWVSCG